MNTKDKGDISEAEVTTALLRKGWSVSTPVGDNDRYDLIADTGQKLIRVQVKTAHWENGKVVFNTPSVVSKSGGQTKSTGFQWASVVQVLSLYVWKKLRRQVQK